MPSTRVVMIFPNAAPMITPIARSITLPRAMKSRNSFHIGPPRRSVTCYVADCTFHVARDYNPVETTVLDLSEQYRRLVELSPDGILVSRHDRLVLANAAALRLCGMDSADWLLGTATLDLFTT